MFFYILILIFCIFSQIIILFQISFPTISKCFTIFYIFFIFFIGQDGIYGTGVRVERRGFEYYRIDVMRQIAKRISKAEKLAEMKALNRRNDREKKLVFAHTKIGNKYK